MPAPASVPAPSRTNLLHALARPLVWLWTHVVMPFVLWLLRWIRYAYYLRFAILLWWFPVLLAILNRPSLARSLTGGIITPVTPLQYVCATFFLISGSFVSLILAHVVVINGKDRFGDDPPPLLLHLLADKNPHWEWLAPVLSQLNNAYVVWYFFSNGVVELVDGRYICWGVLGGAALGAVFWYAISAFYYLVYRQTQDAPERPAATLILPRAFLGLSQEGKHLGFGDVLEHATLPISSQWIARLFPVDGYRWLVPVLDESGKPRTGTDGKPLMTGGQLYEGHFFSILAAIGFYSLYWVLWPITAPVLMPAGAAVAMAIFGLCALCVVLVVAFARSDRDRVKLVLWKVILAILILGFAAALPLMYFGSDTERFPILASVLILVIGASWTFGGIAFFADRYRVPVLTAFLLCLVLPRVVPGFNGKPLTGAKEEHYLSYISGAAQANLPTPGEVLDARLRAEYCGGSPCAQLPADAKPAVIVVTSTGGGIHAAAWTTAVLGQLEHQFNDQFHQHVALLSTVSGGSVGLFDYLRELDSATKGTQSDWKRMNSGSRCSSLEAVGWGLVYYDIPKAVVPLVPYFISPSTGENDLLTEPLGKDRTWALRRAMERNLNDPFCSQWAYSGATERVKPERPGDPHIQLAEVLAHQQSNPDSALDLTLGKLSATAGSSPMPAFTMNTTTVEGGNRFLLANYFVPRDNSANPLITKPAYSFLTLYSPNAAGPANDLPLATAAQMSATFPFVSSAATLRAAPPQSGVHFVDGGYYDNDGTASAIEFLRYALSESKLLAHPAAQKSSSRAKPAPPDTYVPLRVVLVEIRNSPDSAANGWLVSGTDQGKAWNVVSEIAAPLQAFWSAGHESVTSRNRNALGLLEGAFHDRLVLQHFVIDDRATARKPLYCVPPNSLIPNDPLNWFLTPCQQEEVDYSALAGYNLQRYKLVQACFADGEQRGCPAENQEERLGSRP